MTWLPLRPDLQGHPAYGAPEAHVAARLNVNENPYPASPAIVKDIAEAVGRAAGEANRYPPREFPELRAALATYLRAEAGIEFAPEMIWAANGSNEVMVQLLQAFASSGRTVISAPPTYSMYPEYALITESTYLTVPRDDNYRVNTDAIVQAASRHSASVVLLASPNNPTGTAMDADQVDQLATALRGCGPGGCDTVLVMDEAYAEFRRPTTISALTLVERHRNLAVSRTMSKAFAMAGLRLGYLVANAE
ncbi:MAG: aminotransferase class I/II-fold pyridoxal phosphate-dependent enzyme, partial [Bowdeniella nasicola]|nr:aminotransferase class I/II-fold pyridoxal phosphate-dependent enzyme [Bowdeniella nasicola]